MEDVAVSVLDYLANSFSGARSLLSPLVIGATLGLCLGLYLYWRPQTGFLAWAFPRRAWLRRGTLVDLGLWVLAHLISATLILNMTAVSSLTSVWLWKTFGAMPATPGPASLILTTVIVFVVTDFLGFLVHRGFHRSRPLWEIHAVHHSAEELTPVTAFRHHPLYTFFDLTVAAVVLGVVQGFVLMFLTGTVDLVTLAGINVFFAVFRLTGANLRHSHIFLRYPAWLEHILISPAQHQVHHSLDPRHHEKNYGEVLAIWDWMFGSLYIPGPEEKGVAFGLADARGQPLPQPHGTLRKAIFGPLRQLWVIFQRRLWRRL